MKVAKWSCYMQFRLFNQAQRRAALSATSRTNRLPLPTRIGGLLALLLLSLALPCVFSLASAASVRDTSDLSPYEQRLFSHAYPEESVSQRLARLEGVVFGETQPGSETDRRTRLIHALEKNRRYMGDATPMEGDLASSPNLAPLQQPTSSPDTAGSPPAYREPDPSWGNGDPQSGQIPDFETFRRPTASAAPAAPPDATDYPTVTALEREVFGRDFIREDIRHRLARLENRTFGASDPSAQLVDRVDRLLSRYPGVTPQSLSQEGPLSAPQTPSHAPSDRSRDMHLKVDALERRFFSGKTHPNELLTERLDRLERGLYGKTFPGESPDTRLNRLISGYRVNPANRSQSRPAYQSPPSFQPPPSTPANFGNGMSPNMTSRPANPPQNIQIGAGMSQNSTQQFSPELLSMLPPDVQSQLSGGRSGGTVISSPGTVVIEEQNQTYGSGFQPFGGQPMGYVNQYSLPQYSPGVQTQSRTTTLIQPNGTSAIYRFSNTPVTPPMPQNYMGQPYMGQGYPGQAYMGNPGLTQSLANLELQAFGWINPSDPPYVRLARLETTVFGRTYAGYPDLQRMTNLQNAVQRLRSGARAHVGNKNSIGATLGNALLMNMPAPTYYNTTPGTPGVVITPYTPYQ